MIASVVAGRRRDGGLIILGTALVAAEEERVRRRGISAASEMIAVSMRADVRLIETCE